MTKAGRWTLTSFWVGLVTGFFLGLLLADTVLR